MSHHRVKVLACALAACALLVAPAAGQAATKKAKPPTNAALSKKVNALGKQIGSINTTLGGLKAIADAAPTIVSALTQLKDGLTRLGSAYTAVEYGAIGLYGGTGTTPIGNIRPNTADIPDDGNTALISAQVVSGNPAAGTAVPLKLTAAIRSAESDGSSDTSDPVGQAGGNLIAICAPSAPNALSGGVCGAGPGTTAAGSIVAGCQTPSGTFSLPDGTSTSQNLVNLQRAQLRTASSAPSAALVETGGTGYDLRLTGSGGAACALPALGAPYQVIITVQALFADIPTSLSPGPTD